jgi:hypothetical protein
MTKHTREKWAERIREWRASGLSAEEFTAGKDYEPSSLRWATSQLQDRPKPSPSTTEATAKVPQRRRPAERASATPSPAPPFLPVRMRASPAMSTDVVVEVGDARIRVSRGADLTFVGEVVRALQGVVR